MGDWALMLEKIHEQVAKQAEELGLIAIWILIIISTRALLHPSSRGFFITLFRLLLCLPFGLLVAGVMLEFNFGAMTSSGGGITASIIFENSNKLVKKYGDKAGVWVDLLVKKIIEKWTK